MNYLFDKNWFKDKQRILLWLLNTPIIKIWFRWVLRIHNYDCKEKITEITPNSFSWGDRYFKKKGKWYLKKTTDFRTQNKYSKRLFYAFYPLWLMFHAWDMIINFMRLPKLNLGFDTLTVYPDADPETTSVDGTTVRSSVNEIWGTIRSGAGDNAEPSTAASYPGAVDATTTTNQYSAMYRGIILWDTSSISDDSTIDSTTLSIYVQSKVDNLGLSIGITSSNPASNTNLVNTDHALANFGSTKFATDKTITSITTSAYNDYTLNTNGLNNISKTGVSKFAVRSAQDIDNTNPTWSSGVSGNILVSFAETAGTSQDPKLVVTYTLPATGNFFKLF